MLSPSFRPAVERDSGIATTRTRSPGRTRSGWQVEHLRRRSRHELHLIVGPLADDLRSTSSPRPVRLSFDNLDGQHRRNRRCASVFVPRTSP